MEAGGHTARRHQFVTGTAGFLIQHGMSAPSESIDADPMALLLEHFSLEDEVSDHIESGLTLDEQAAEPPAA